MSTQTPQPLIWLARSSTRYSVVAGRSLRLAALPIPCSACRAPGTVSAGLSIRACMIDPPSVVGDHSPDRRTGRAGGDSEPSERADAALEEAPLRLVAGQLERTLVRGAGLIGAPDPAQEVGAGRMEVLVVVQRQRVDDPERRLRARDLGDGDRPVQLHDRRAGHAGELAVEG